MAFCVWSTGDEVGTTEVSALLLGTIQALRVKGAGLAVGDGDVSAGTAGGS